jgi:lipid-binding SYLF domain-containing protein
MSTYIRLAGTVLVLALATLYAKTPRAQELAEKAKGILVFLNIVKAGFLVGAQYGDGALRVQGGRSGMTTLSPRRTAWRPACRRSATPCSS